MNEPRADSTLWVATLNGASSPFTASYPVSWSAAVALVRSLWPTRSQRSGTELRGAVRP